MSTARGGVVYTHSMNEEEVLDEDIIEEDVDSGETVRDEVKTIVELATLFHNHDLHIPTRTVFMGGHVYDDGSEGGVDAIMSESVVKNLHILEALSHDDITILTDNIGGDEYHGAAIVDAILRSPCKVAMIVRGHAMSMGSIILQAAGRRIMGPNATQMIHYGTWGDYTHAKTAQQHAKEGLRWDEWMERWYLNRIREKLPDFPLERLKQMLDHDTYLNAEDSIALGLADEIG